MNKLLNYALIRESNARSKSFATFKTVEYCFNCSTFGLMSGVIVNGRTDTNHAPSTDPKDGVFTSYYTNVSYQKFNLIVTRKFSQTMII